MSKITDLTTLVTTLRKVCMTVGALLFIVLGTVTMMRASTPAVAQGAGGSQPELQALAALKR